MFYLTALAAIAYDHYVGFNTDARLIVIGCLIGWAVYSDGFFKRYTANNKRHNQ